MARPEHRGSPSRDVAKGCGYGATSRRSRGFAEDAVAESPMQALCRQTPPSRSMRPGWPLPRCLRQTTSVDNNRVQFTLTNDLRWIPPTGRFTY